MVGLAKSEGPWQGQVGRAREWFEPHLERIYDSAQVRMGDLVQLERLAQQFATTGSVSCGAGPGSTGRHW